MSVFDKNYDPLADPQVLDRHIERALRVSAPPAWQVEIFYRMVRQWCRPMVLDAGNVPEQPCLFVGNHSLFALDGAIILPVLLKELHRFARPMGDRFLFSVPPVADLLLSYGLVMGHPEVCAALMADGQDILVFPGGAYESVKPSSERYRLQWKERYGFVRLAAKHGYTIMPFGLVGPDEFYNHLLEGRDLPDSPLGQVLKHLGLLNDNTRTDVLPPLPVGSLGSFLPKPQRCYLGFGKPIDLSGYKGRQPTAKTLRSIRDQVAGQVESQLARLLATRERHRGEDGLLRRLLTL